MDSRHVICPQCRKSLKFAKPPTQRVSVRCPKCDAQIELAPAATGSVAVVPSSSAVNVPPPSGESFQPLPPPPPVETQSRESLANSQSPKSGIEHRHSELLWGLCATGGFIAILFTGWYIVDGLRKSDGTGSTATGNTPVQFAETLPAGSRPRPGRAGQSQRDASNVWLKTHVAGNPVKMDFFVERVEILDQPDGTFNANLSVTIDPALDGPVSLADGVWGGDFTIDGTPYYLELWGENPLITGLSQEEADKLRAL